MKLTKSQQYFNESQKLFPGGVNSPVRAFRAVGGNPIFISHAKGSKIYDVDGNQYIDYVCSWGPLILGHAHTQIVHSLQRTIEKGTSYGAPTEIESELAKLIMQALPSIQMIRFVNSGTEATMSAIRLARGYTGKDLIIKFEGCYHGHADSFLAKAGSGITTLSIPDSAGVPQEIAKTTITCPYNDISQFEQVVDTYYDNIAAVIIEPVAGNMGVIPPKEGFLTRLREITSQNNILLIFDEVITGFRVGWHGAQGKYNITPDLTTLGKIIGGGLPVGAYGGRAEIMQKIAPLGNVYQAGTLSGNPLAMTAGYETLKILSDQQIYTELEHKSQLLIDEISQNIQQLGIPVFITRVGSMFSIFFTHHKVYDYATATTSDVNRYSQYFKNMLNQGVYIPPSQFETCFVSAAHTDEDIQHTIEANYIALKNI